MKLDAGLGHQLERIPASAKEAEAMGFDGVRTAEMNHDPFFPLLLAAEHTQKIELISSIAVGFARSPMLLANIGHDLNAYSKGRVTIGLGSQTLLLGHIPCDQNMVRSAINARFKATHLRMDRSILRVGKTDFNRSRAHAE